MHLATLEHEETSSIKTPWEYRSTHCHSIAPHLGPSAEAATLDGRPRLPVNETYHDNKALLSLSLSDRTLLFGMLLKFSFISGADNFIK